MLKTSHLLCVPLIACLILTAGCGGKKSDTLKVSGVVTFDGTNLDQGSISFSPTTSNAASAGGKIVNGAYSVDIAKGDYKVSVNSSKVVGTKKMYDTPTSPTTDIVEEVIPRNYNSATTLTATISEAKNDLNFTLEPAKGKK